MDTAKTIEYLHPTLKFGTDYEVRNDGKQGDLDYIIWKNEEITQPTQAQLDIAWIEVEKETSLKASMNRLYEIDAELKKLNAPGVIIQKQSLLDINTAKIAELNTEASEIQDYIGENYESSLIDDIYTSLFM